MHTTLITGANRGIGLEFCNQYAAAGWRVLACCRKPEKSAALNKLAAQFPGQVFLHELELTDLARIEQLGMGLAGESIDLLINNAGILPKCDEQGFGHTDYEQWLQAFRINTMAPLKLAETFVTQVARSKLKIMVTITSKMGSIEDSSGGYYTYRSSKAAVNMVVKNLALDLKVQGITAVLLHPGWVQTDMGGPNAMITTGQSVTGMRKVIAGLKPNDSGRFFAYDGQPIPW